MKRAGMNWSFLDEMESKPATFMSFSRQSSVYIQYFGILPGYKELFFAAGVCGQPAFVL
jgi:hypothetical protein